VAGSIHIDTIGILSMRETEGRCKAVYSRKQESILEKQKEDMRALQDDVDRLRDKYDEGKDRSRDQEKELSTQHNTILDR